MFLGGFLLDVIEEKVFTQGKTIVYRRGARGKETKNTVCFIEI